MTEQTIERLAGGVAGAVPEKERKEQVAGQWQLIWWRFRRNKVALVAGAVVGLIYFVAIFAEFLAPFSSDFYNGRYTYAQPQQLHAHLGRESSDVLLDGARCGHAPRVSRGDRSLSRASRVR